MLGIFKKLNANDIKITPFEAHKKYDSTSLASIGVTTSSIAWANSNKADFTEGNRKWFQLDKLYYRDYLGKNRPYRFEVDEVDYQKQERRLYESASVISISQNNYGFGVQPETFEYESDGVIIKDDGYGNLYDNSKGLTNWPEETYRTLYISPVNGFRNTDLNTDNETGNVNPNPISSFNKTITDDSYLYNTVTYTSCSIKTADSHSGFTVIEPYIIEDVALGKTSTVNDFVYSRKDFLLTIPSVNVEITFSGSDGTDSDIITANETTLFYSTGSAGQFNVTESLQNLVDKINQTARSKAFISASFSTINSEETIGTLALTASFSGSWVNGARFQRLTPTISTLGTFEGGKDYVSNNEGYIRINDKTYLNPNNKDFAISFYLHPSTQMSKWMETIGKTGYIITKKNIKKALLDPDIEINPSAGLNLQYVIDPIDRIPYECYLETLNINDKFNPLAPDKVRFNFIRKDDNVESKATYEITTGSLEDSPTHIVLQKSSSRMQIWINGTKEADVLDKTTSTQNDSDISLFSNPITPLSSNSPLPCPISQLMYWDKSLTTSEIANISESITGTYPVGNMFYNNGFATLTHPSYVNATGSVTCSYKNVYPITEYEYQCTVSDDEFNYTTNITARKEKNIGEDILSDFATGSNFRPYVTTVGLYDDSANLLAVGKLGQPIKMSEETDTTFVIRFDT